MVEVLSVSRVGSPLEKGSGNVWALPELGIRLIWRGTLYQPKEFSFAMTARRKLSSVWRTFGSTMFSSRYIVIAVS